MERTYVFDLDGTITLEESLPRLAKEISTRKQAEIAMITRKTLYGGIPFEESFRKRVAMLQEIPIFKARTVMSMLPLCPDIVKFIQNNPQRCILVTCNLDTWIAPIVQKLGCKVFSSKAIVNDGMVTGVESVLNKDAIMQILQKYYNGVVGVGDSINDIPILKYAEVGIAYSGVHKAPRELVAHADYVVETPQELMNILRTLDEK